MTQDYERIFPPKEIFLDPDQASWDWEAKGMLGSAACDLPAEGGIRFWSDGRSGNHLPYNGFPYPPALECTAIFKRVMIQKLRDPIAIIRWRRTAREMKELANITIRRYFLKPDRYCRACREIFRIVTFMTKDETWGHSIASIFQWDFGYRARVQFYVSRLADFEWRIYAKAPRFEADPKKAMNRLMDFAMKSDRNQRLPESYGRIRKLINLAWFVPKARSIIKAIAGEIRLEEFRMDESDVALAFKK